MTNETDKIINELKAEEIRLCTIISNLHREIGSCNEKIEKQEQVINKLIELIGVMQSY